LASRRTQEIGVGVLLVGVMALLAWMAIQVGAVGSLGPQVVVEARIADAAGIKPGAAVSVAGVDIGRVETMRVDHDVAVAEVTLDASAEVRQGATLRIRARSVLGEKYLELEPGPREAPLLQQGAVIEVPGEQVEIDEMVGAIGPLLGAVDADALARALSVVSDALEDDPERLARVMTHVETIAANGATASERLPGLVDRLEGTLDRADAALGALSARASEAKSPLARVDRASAELETTAAKLPALLDDASETMADLRGAVADAKGLVEGFDGIDADVRQVLENVAEIDKWELRRLLREEGILIRVREREVVPTP
jgi:virulence factor Mce-like protein